MGYSMTLDVPENVYDSLLKTAVQVGQQPETLVVQWLKTITQTQEVGSLEKLIGAFSRYIPNWATEPDKSLGQTVPEFISKLKALERIKQHRAEILAARGNQPLNIDVATILQDTREERDADFITNFKTYCD